MLKKDLRLSPARRLSFRYIVTVLGLLWSRCYGARSVGGAEKLAV